MKIIVFWGLWLGFLVGSEIAYYHNGRLETLEPLPALSRFAKVKYFKTNRNIKLGVDNRIILKPKDGRCKEEITKKYPHHFILSNGDVVLIVQDTKEAFEVSKKLYEEGCALFSHPDFLIFPKKRFFDPLFSQQWNFHDIGQDGIVPDIDLDLYEAWQYATGKGVKIALIDNGFDFSHPDLKNAFVDQIDLVDYDLNASYDNGYEIHGTACAGLIAARRNGIGVQGAAYDASLIGIKLIGSYPSGEDRALYISSIVRAFLYAKNGGADVINCSWGTYNVADAVRDVIEDVAHNGRNGKGVPIVFASGNEGRGQWYWAGDESALPSVIAVGAVTDQGDVAWYSNYGPALDFVAPSGGGILRIATTDVVGPLGYADGRYGHPNYCYATDLTGFNGTSAAAPQISGVIALMIERNPDLTKDEIVEILQKTAKKIGTLPYVNGRNDYMGYGLVDAEAAVKEVIRQKTLTEVVGRKFSIEGYFIRIGERAFDWVYIDRKKKIVAKLSGMDKDGTLLWYPVLNNVFDSINIDMEDNYITFGDAESQDKLAQELMGKSFGIKGFFVHYGLEKYDWIFVAQKTFQAYKLEKLNYQGNFLWIPLRILGVLEQNTISFEE